MKKLKYRIVRMEYNSGKVAFMVQVKTFLRWKDANLYGDPVYPSNSIETGYSQEFHLFGEAKAKLRDWEGQQVKKVQVVSAK